MDWLSPDLVRKFKAGLEIRHYVGFYNESRVLADVTSYFTSTGFENETAKGPHINGFAFD